MGISDRCGTNVSSFWVETTVVLCFVSASEAGPKIPDVASIGPPTARDSKIFALPVLDGLCQDYWRTA